MLISTKLIKIIESLSTDEFGNWKKFLSSSMFNTDKNLLKFYHTLSKHYPSFDSPKFTKEKIYSTLFPDAAWNDGKWRNLTSKMTKSLEWYLILLETNENDFEKRKLLVRALGQRNLYQLFSKEMQLLDNELTIRSSSDQVALLDKMLLNQSYYYHPFTDKVKKIQYLVSAKKYAEEYFKSQQLKYSCDEMVHSQITNAQPNFKHTSTPTIYFIVLYEKVHNFLKKGTDDSFQDAKYYLKEEIEKFNNGDKKFGLLHLINFAISKINMGDYSYKNEMFDLFKIGLKQDIFIEDGIISEKTFTNIISLSSSLGEFVWAKNFIQTYEKYLPIEVKESAKTLGFANLYFHQKKISGVIDILLHFNSKSLTELFIGKTMLLKSYFEFLLQDTSFFEMVIAYTYSFEHFVKRKKKLPEDRRFGCLNLSKIVRRLSKLFFDNNWNQKTKANFMIMIESTEPLIGKNWLRSRVMEM